MKLNSQLAGTPFVPYAAEITQRQTTNFAAALGDDNPLYFDDDAPGGVVAPPTFPVSVTWPVLSNLGEFIQDRNFPREVLATQVHYTEHLILHRLVRPGDELNLEGKIAAILPHRAGTHAVVRLTASDAAGERVFTEYIGAMLRGVQCEGEDGPEPKDSLPEHPLAAPSASPVWTSLVLVDPLAPYAYDAGADIEFPIHTSPKFAKAVGLPGIILQGTATLGLAVRELVNNEAGADPGAVKEIACSFTGMVMPGSEIEVCCLEVREDDAFTHIFFEVINAENKKAVKNGYLKLERQVP